MIKMKELITERGGVDPSYAVAFRDYFEKKYGGKKIDGWELYVDHMTGTFEWESTKSDNIIMATPFWEDEPKIPVNVMDADGDEMLDTSYPLKPSGDFKKDEANYLKQMKRIFKAVR